MTDMMMSVVVPTHNRMDTLPEVLSALEEQTNAPPFEIVLVDDGSTDDTASFLAGRHFAVPNRVLRQVNRGPAAARNAGVAAASGRRVAFLGDDTVPEQGWLAAHQAAHDSRGSGPELAVLGYTKWHPRIHVSPFLHYLNEYGLQFGYRLIRDPENVPFNFFYTSNLSLTRRRALEQPFHEGFPYPAWEDIELSYRLAATGQRLVYEPHAIVLHDHPTDIKRFCSRQEKSGFCAVRFHGLHPELGGFLGLSPDGPPALPNAGLHKIRELVAEALQNLPVTIRPLWNSILHYHYVVGLRRGWQAKLESRPESS